MTLRCFETPRFYHQTAQRFFPRRMESLCLSSSAYWICARKTKTVKVINFRRVFFFLISWYLSHTADWWIRFWKETDGAPWNFRAMLAADSLQIAALDHTSNLLTLSSFLLTNLATDFYGLQKILENTKFGQNWIWNCKIFREFFLTCKGPRGRS